MKKVPKIAYPQLKIIHQAPEMTKGQAILLIPSSIESSPLSKETVEFEGLVLESQINAELSEAVWSSGRKGFTKKVAVRKPAPIMA